MQSSVYKSGRKWLFFFFFPQWSYNKTLSFCSHSPFFKNRPVLSGREDTALRTTNAEWEILLRYQRGGKKTQQEFRRRCREQLNLDAGFLQPQQVPLVQFIFLPLYIKKKTLCSPWLECPVVEVPPKGRVNNIYLKRARAHVESGRLGWIKPVWNPCYCGSCWRGFFFFFSHQPLDAVEQLWWEHACDDTPVAKGIFLASSFSLRKMTSCLRRLEDYFN